jgi:hypothetical protein
MAENLKNYKVHTVDGKVWSIQADSYLFGENTVDFDWKTSNKEWPKSRYRFNFSNIIVIETLPPE